MDIYKKIHLEQLFQPLVNSKKNKKNHVRFSQYHVQFCCSFYSISLTFAQFYLNITAETFISSAVIIIIPTHQLYKYPHDSKQAQRRYRLPHAQWH